MFVEWLRGVGWFGGWGRKVAVSGAWIGWVLGFFQVENEGGKRSGSEALIFLRFFLGFLGIPIRGF